MASTLNPYISLRDTAREAGRFYQSVFGGELSVMTFAEGMPTGDASLDQLVMHSQLTAPNGFVMMVADTPPSMEVGAGGNISISLSGTDEAELTGYWTALSASGTVTVPLERAPWGDQFGVCLDRFGVAWMFNIGSTPGD